MNTISGIFKIFKKEGNLMTNYSDSMDIYLKEVSKIPVLTQEAQKTLALKAKAGDKEARNTLLKTNLRFVIKCAKAYRGLGLDMEDLISEGNLGLLSAIDKFDAEKGFHFITYAVWWIRQGMLKAIYEKSRLIRLPCNKALEVAKLKKAQNMVQKDALKTDAKVLASILGLAPQYVAELLKLSSSVVSFDSVITGQGENAKTLGDILEDPQSSRVEENALTVALKEDLKKALATLQEKEAQVIKLRYGLGGQKPLSLRETGKACNLTKERIRQIEKRAILRLQHPYRAARLKEYIA